MQRPKNKREIERLEAQGVQNTNVGIKTIGHHFLEHREHSSYWLIDNEGNNNWAILQINFGEIA